MVKDIEEHYEGLRQKFLELNCTWFFNKYFPELRAKDHIKYKLSWNLIKAIRDDEKSSITQLSQGMIKRGILTEDADKLIYDINNANLILSERAQKEEGIQRKKRKGYEKMLKRWKVPNWLSKKYFLYNKETDLHIKKLFPKLFRAVKLNKQSKGDYFIDELVQLGVKQEDIERYVQELKDQFQKTKN